MAGAYDHLWIPKRTAKDWGRSEYRIIRNWTPREQRQQKQSEQTTNQFEQAANRSDQTTNQSSQATNQLDWTTNQSHQTTSRSDQTANRSDPHNDEVSHEKTIGSHGDILDDINEIEEERLPHAVTQKVVRSPLPTSAITTSHLTPSHLTPTPSLRALQMQRSERGGGGGGKRGGGGGGGVRGWQEELEEEEEMEQEEMEEEDVVQMTGGKLVPRREEQMAEEERRKEEEEEGEERSAAAEKEAPEASSPASLHSSSLKRKGRQRKTSVTTSHKLWQSRYIERTGHDLHELDISFSLYDQAVREAIAEENCAAVQRAVVNHWRLTKKEVMSVVRGISIISALEKRHKKESSKHRHLQREALSMLSSLRKSNGNFIKAAGTAKKTRESQRLSVEQKEIEEISRDILSFSAKLSSSQ